MHSSHIRITCFDVFLFFFPSPIIAHLSPLKSSESCFCCHLVLAMCSHPRVDDVRVWTCLCVLWQPCRISTVRSLLVNSCATFVSLQVKGHMFLFDVCRLSSGKSLNEETFDGSYFLGDFSWVQKVINSWQKCNVETFQDNRFKLDTYNRTTINGTRHTES